MPNSTWTILERKDGRKAVILRYEDRVDYLERMSPYDGDKGDEEDIPFNQCIRSEFFGTRRMMLILDTEAV